MYQYFAQSIFNTYQSFLKHCSTSTVWYPTLECVDVRYELDIEFDFKAALSVCATAFNPSLGLRLHQNQTIKPVMYTRLIMKMNVMTIMIFSVSSSCLALARIWAWHLESQAIVFSVRCTENYWKLILGSSEKKASRVLLVEQWALLGILHPSEQSVA